MKKSLIKILLLSLFLFIVGVCVFLYLKDKKSRDSTGALYAAERQENKIEALNDVIAKYPKTTAGNTARYRKAQYLKKEGKYEEAITCLKQCKISEEDELRLTYHELLGGCYKALGQYSKALSHYHNALKYKGCDDMKGDISFDMYTIYRKKGEVGNAKDCLNKIRKEYPTYRDINKVAKAIVALSSEIDGNGS